MELKQYKWYIQMMAFKKEKAIIINQKNQQTKDIFKVLDSIRPEEEDYAYYFYDELSDCIDDFDEAYWGYCKNGYFMQNVKDTEYMIIEPDNFIKNYLQYCRENKILDEL